MSAAFPARPLATGPWHKRYLPLLVGLCLALPLLGIALSALFTKTEPGKHKIVTQITLVAPPPPPPQPKPPEPPKPKEELKVEQPPTPQPKQDNSEPPPGPLGLDSQGTGPGDAFGLAGRPGGRDIIGSGGGGLDLTLFGNNAARQIAQDLARNPKLKSAMYKIEIRVWLARDGRIEREEIVRGTGNRDLDEMIREGLNELGAIHQPVPENLPQPLRIRVTSTDA
jgi:periplasmic protein TonB